MSSPERTTTVPLESATSPESAKTKPAAGAAPPTASSPPGSPKKIRRTVYQFLHDEDNPYPKYEKKRSRAHEHPHRRSNPQTEPPPQEETVKSPSPPSPDKASRPPTEKQASPTHRDNESTLSPLSATRQQSRPMSNPPSEPVDSLPSLLTQQFEKPDELVQVEGPLHPVISSISLIDLVHNLFIVFVIFYYLALLIIELINNKVGHTKTEIISITLSMVTGTMVLILEIILVHLSKLMWTASDPETPVIRAKRRVKCWLGFTFCMAIFTSSLVVVLVLLPSRRYELLFLLSALLSLTLRIAFLLFGAKFYWELLYLYYHSSLLIGDSTGRPSVVTSKSALAVNRNLEASAPAQI